MSQEHHSHASQYIKTFFALIVLTVLTVSVSYIHLPAILEWSVALSIVMVKVGLVLSIFMHFNQVPRYLYWATALLTLFFIVALLSSVSAQWLHFGELIEGSL